METLTTSLWVLLFLAIPISELRADDNYLGNGTVQTQRNATSLPLTTELPQEHADTEGTKNTSHTEIETSRGTRVGGGGVSGGGGGGGGYGWGWGWGGGRGGGNGGGGGSGGGGGGGGGRGGWWGWGCRKSNGGRGRRHHMHRKRVFNIEDYKLGEFAQCMGKGRCRGMRLDCPLHCGGPCFYDCQHMCKAHCRR